MENDSENSLLVQRHDGSMFHSPFCKLLHRFLVSMIKLRFLAPLIGLVVMATAMSYAAASRSLHEPGGVRAQSRRAARKASVCGNPLLSCKTSVPFQPYDLPFRVPKDAVIFDTELFYAIVLKSVGAGETDCDVFVPESERLALQALFPDHKVFTSRCPDVETLHYTNTDPTHRFMGIYAGSTLAEAKRLLEAVKATGKFPGANIRRMRTGFNGT